VADAALGSQRGPYPYRLAFQTLADVVPSAVESGAPVLETAAYRDDNTDFCAKKLLADHLL
jgi:hypothetical protein